LSILDGRAFDATPDDAKLGKYDFVQVFASSQAEMESLVKRVAKAGKYDCLFWACYPKSIGKQKFEINRNSVWSALALAGLRPVSQIAIDEKWSALRGRDPELVGKKIKTNDISENSSHRFMRPDKSGIGTNHSAFQRAGHHLQ
jgi:hypothetical protein